MVKVGNEAPARWRKPLANGYSPHPRQARLSSPRLYSSLVRRKAATGSCIYRMQADGSLGGDNSQREDGSER